MGMYQVQSPEEREEEGREGRGPACEDKRAACPLGWAGGTYGEEVLEAEGVLGHK